MTTASEDLVRWAAGRNFKTILADPPWRFQNSTGKVAPEHRRLGRYQTLSLDDIAALPLNEIAASTAHLYLWVPNALLPEGLAVMQAWGFAYKSNIVWHKVRKDGGSDGRGVGFYFRNVTEMLLFGVRGKNARTLDPGRRQVNYLATQKREHSRKPDEIYPIMEQCSPGPRAELFARGPRAGWACWGDEAEVYTPAWATYANHSQIGNPEFQAPRKNSSPTKKPVLAAAHFIESAILAASGVEIAAHDVYDAYVATCTAKGFAAASPASFAQTLSARARMLGASKTKSGGRVAYANVRFAA